MSYFFEVKSPLTSEQRVLLSMAIAGNRFGFTNLRGQVNAELTQLVDVKEKSVTFGRRGIGAELNINVRGGKILITTQVGEADADGKTVYSEVRLAQVNYQNDKQQQYQPTIFGLANIFNDMIAKPGANATELTILRNLNCVSVLAEAVDMGYLELTGGANWTTDKAPIVVRRAGFEKVVDEKLVTVTAERRARIVDLMVEIAELRFTGQSIDTADLEQRYKRLAAANQELMDRWGGILSTGRGQAMDRIVASMRDDGLFITQEDGLYIVREDRRWNRANNDLTIAGPYSASDVDTYMHNFSGWGK